MDGEAEHEGERASRADGDEVPRTTPHASSGRVTRRALLAGAAGALGGAALGIPLVAGQGSGNAPPLPPIPPDPTRLPGPPTSALGERSRFVAPARGPVGQVVGSSLTPLHELTGTITPADLHFERHHSGIALVDPARYRLLVHGLVERAVVFTLDDLRRLPAVSRVCFVECAGNGRAAYRSPKPEMTPQRVDGMTSNSEWTGVPLAVLLAEVGVRAGVAWVLAEGGDASLLSRSVPLAKCLDDAIVAYAQNGEPIRPANGYPVRLVLPGWEGNMSVKWLRRLELVARPNMSRDETAKYTDPLSNGTARQFSFVMDAKSLLTGPLSFAAAGWWPLTGLAWSGRGVITRVEVSTDAGQSWAAAELQAPVLARAHTRFRHMWRWDGGRAVIMTRATDSTGYVQPTLAEFRAARGAGTDYHFNAIRAWRLSADGRLSFDDEA